jgi:pimeloyl-ACP methyl ester carboxylesterase
LVIPDVNISGYRYVSLLKLPGFSGSGGLTVKNLRTYGNKPYRVAVVHGGPGAAGDLAPVAEEMSSVVGILEPLQTENTFEGQVKELHDVLEKNADLPVILIGHSWGAFLSFIVTARYPALVKKLVMVGGGPFEEKYADNIAPERLNRLSEDERIEAFRLIEIINDPSVPGKVKDRSMARLSALFLKADTYAALPLTNNAALEFSEEINRRVWGEAKKLRISGELLELGKKIMCPVVAVHGDYDPHLAAGVKEPLSRTLGDFRFILLEKCGHEPWLERYARDEFYTILKEEIA